MDSLKIWLSSICFGAIGLGLFKILIPNGGMTKVMKTICGIFMLSIIIYPLSQTIKFDIAAFEEYKSSIETENTLTESMNNLVMERSKAAYQQDVADILSANGITHAKIDILMDTFEDNSISIKQVVIYIDESQMEKSAKIKSEVEEELGFPTVVYKIEEEASGY